MPLTAASKRRAIKVALLGLAGLTIATYALSVETQMHEPGYEAACDIGAGFSCTAVFSSEYAHPLSHWGLVKQGDAHVERPLGIPLTTSGGYPDTAVERQRRRRKTLLEKIQWYAPEL